MKDQQHNYDSPTRVRWEAFFMIPVIVIIMVMVGVIVWLSNIWRGIYHWTCFNLYDLPPRDERNVDFWCWYASYHGKDVVIDLPDLLTERESMKVVEAERKIVCMCGGGKYFTSKNTITSADGTSIWQSTSTFG